MPRPRIHTDRAAKQRVYRERQAAARQQELRAKGLPAAPPIPTMPSSARWNALIEQAKIALQTVVDEMQSYFEERSEQWQESERGELFIERADAIESLLVEMDTLPGSE